MSVLQSIFSFIVAIAILVTIHEFGHFWVARKLGVKVLRFSVGFGKPLWSKIGADETEYQVAAIPLGGYVKMADEREGNVAEEDLPRAFNRQSVWKRFAIVAAGPIANFLFAIVAFACMYMVGVNGVKPIIGKVAEDSIAMQVGIQEDDLITSINGQAVVSWQTASITMVSQALETGVIEVATTGNNGSQDTHQIDLSDSRKLLGDEMLLDYLGIQPWRPTLDATIGALSPNGAATRAGIKTGDQVISAAGEQVADWSAYVDIIRASPDQEIEVVVRRESQTITLQVTPEGVVEQGTMVGKIGAGPKIDPNAYDRVRVKEKFGFFSSIGKGVEQTWNLTTLTVRVLTKLVTGQASTKNISGPISIAEYAGVSAAIGLAAFLGFLAMISVSLGILNLLPIPILDGGHLMFYLIEMIKGSPVSAAFEAAGQRLGIAMLGGLMFLAFYNDLSRLFTG